MLTILKLFFDVGFLATIIHGNPADLLDEMAASNKTINGYLRPLVKCFIGRGTYGFLFRGELVSNSRAIAMKFVKQEHKNATDREYEIYTYLNAIDNPKIESYGISCVYYYNEWNGYMVTAFSNFDGGNLEQRGFFEQPIDSLIMFRQFVLQSKYIHSQGVRHDDIKPGNIMLRNGRSYLIDFNYSAKLSEFSGGGTLNFASRMYHKEGVRCAIDDWESFLYTMCYLNSLELQWFPATEIGDPNDSDVIRECGDLKTDIDYTLREIKTIESKPLRNVFQAFANEVFANYGNHFPNYDHLDKMITASILQLINSTQIPLFSWLTCKEIEAANHDPPLPDIRNDFKNPSKFRQFTYKAVNYTRFYQLKKVKSSNLSSALLKRQKSMTKK